ncbi:MAG: glycosyltransferase [Gemmatimonadota bacterium]|nr:glycosyltransferase [Gemmatimonadota bacterium]
MKALLVHERYIRPGGEDVVFEAEGELLESRGHTVVRFTEENRRIPEMSSLVAAGATVWNPTAARRIRSVVRRERPDVVHFHNTFPLISPAAYGAVRAEGVPVVQTLHNYRLVCPMARLFRDGASCEDCVGKSVPWPGVLHACYRDSRAASAAVSAMLAVHRALGTWRTRVDRYLVLSEFARELFAEGGLPPDRMVVHPNHVEPDPGLGPAGGEFALFVGRLDEEKGVDTLLAAWDRMEGVPLRIVGDGPEAWRVEAAADRNPAVEWTGRLPRAEVLDSMRSARMLIVPSKWYEGWPLVVLEAFAIGLPVVASDLGVMVEMVEEGRNGVRFRPGDPAALAKVVEELWGDDAALEAMRRHARAEYEARYTGDAGYRRLMGVYTELLEQAPGREPAASAR